ncbi:MAG: RidA family protein [Chloroflexi bacterium]|nr:RidA family protein [Chloroflexota bacterium]MCL5273787.1 RidA family protein [Chloroflexota bacterium]
MAKQQIRTEKAPIPAGPYSQGLRVGDFVFVAGQGPNDPVTRKLAGETIEEQTAQTLLNVRAILEAAGASMADVVKTTVHLSDLSLFSRFNKVYESYFPDPKPVRTTVGSQLMGIMVEIDVIAYVGDK